MKRAAVALAFVVAACGGSAEPSQTPSNAVSPPPEGSTDVHTATPSNTGGGARSPEIAGARAEIDRAEERIAAAQSDCAEACRALASMERAADHLCALDSGAECSRVRSRVEAARERVRATCGDCGR